jgi:hypothetical protein
VEGAPKSNPATAALTAGIFKFASDPIWLGANSKVVKIQEFPRIAASRSEATKLPAQRKTSALGVATERIVLQNLACFLSNPPCCPNVALALCAPDCGETRLLFYHRGVIARWRAHSSCYDGVTG